MFQMEKGRWIDVSQPLTNDIAVWPGDTPFSFHLSLTKAETNSVNIGQLSTSTHTGTHVDAPFHFAEDGKKIHELDLQTFIGDARLIDVTGVPKVGVEELKSHDLLGVKRVILRTRSTYDFKQFPDQYTVLDENVGPYLKERGIILIGIDAPSVDAVDSKTLDAHHSLHQNGITILENLVLRDLTPGDYDLIALPLKIQDGDASPVRAVMQKVE